MITQAEYKRANAEAYLHEVERRGIEQGIKVGRKQGAELGIKDLVHQMLENGADIDTLMKWTKLSEAELRDLLEIDSQS
ncbi:hypothetical protein [Hutsoniella sourekii]|uniref:hypothetical protein n=1 Tax=Hutsoniella sourekii TaxID=87650 RepID=UPI0004B927BE|nr:hypothetical protein [Hutsoniella sourekii]